MKTKQKIVSILCKLGIVTDLEALGNCKESSLIYSQWRDRAKKTNSFFSLFLFKLLLTYKYKHDYDSTIIAQACFMIAARTSMGMGLSGGQAGFLFWELDALLFGIGGPARVIRYENMLFVNSEAAFDKVISTGTMDWLRKEANEQLLEQKSWLVSIPTDQVNHLTAIAKGIPPFGYTVR
jgi:hypothetical protein